MERNYQMNSVAVQGVFRLIKSALTGQPLPLPEGFDLEQVQDLLKKHKIENIVYYGAVNCGIDPRTAVMTGLFSATYKCLYAHERQQREAEQLLRCFEEQGIDHMPLKGMLTKKLYRRSDMRIMGDADILIRMEQYSRIKPLLEQLGFTEKLESDHELVWVKPGLYLELHKRLIPSYNYDYAAYFGDGWRLAKPCADKPYCYELSAEDHLVYLFTHFAKHYRDGGIGIRHLTDLYVFRNAYPQLDEAYVRRELQVLQLDVFYSNIWAALDRVFDDGPGNQATDLIISTVLGSGLYGTKEQRIAAAGAWEKASGNTVGQAKRSRWLRLALPPYSVMREKYPILEKAAILLPVMWVVRWFSTWCTKKQTIRSQQDRMRMMTKSRVDHYEQALQEVGLAFHFEE